MKFTCTQQNFLQGLNIAEKIIGKNFALPILQNILITCKQNKGYIKLSSTDLEMGVEVIIPSRIEEEGGVTVPAKLISSFVRSLPDEKINFSEKNKKVLIQCRNYKSNINGQDAREFPIIPHNQDTDTFSMNSRDFISGMAPVIGSASLLDIKPEISGVFVQFREDDVCFVATDSFRLAEKRIKNNGKSTYLKKIIIPKRACDVLMRVFQDTNDTINIQASSNQITIKNSPEGGLSPKIKFVSKIIDGEYPNYEQIIPTSFKILVKVPKEELIRHIKTAGIFSNKIHEVSLRVNAKDQVLEISSQDAEYGDHYSTIPCEIQGDDEKTILNFQYLLDGIHNLSSDDILLKMNKSVMPILISSSKNDGFKYIVMPIKI